MALDMNIEQLESEGDPIQIGVIHGALTMGTNLKTIDNNLQALVQRGASRLLLDLSDCPYCDSAGLGLLMHIAGLMTVPGRTMRLCGASERVRELLKMTKTEALLPLDADRSASLAALG